MIRTFPDDAGALWRELVGTTGMALIFKHSPCCGVSASAQSNVLGLPALHPELPVWQVDVLGQCDLSRRIAADLGVRHESPQAILLRDGVPVWSVSHGGVNLRALIELVERERGP